MKYSKQREMVLQAVRDNRVHPTAEFVYTYLKKTLPTISLATVYRNLNMLADHGIILRLNMGDGVDHYDGDTSAHHHLYCTECHRVIDIPANVTVHIDESDALKRGYEIRSYEVAFCGRCPNCSQKTSD